ETSDAPGAEVEVERLAGIIAELSPQIVSLQGSLAKVEADLQAAESRSMEAESALASLQGIFSSKESELSAALSLCSQREAELASLRIAMGELQEQAENLTSQREEALTLIETLQDQVTFVQEKNEVLTIDLSEKAELAVKSEAQLSDALARIESVEVLLQAETLRSKTFLEQFEDWQVVYKLALEQIGCRNESLQKIGVALNKFKDSALPSFTKLTEEGAEDVDSNEIPRNDSELPLIGMADLAKLDLEGLSYIQTDLDSSPSSRLMGSSFAIGTAESGELKRYGEAVKEAYTRVAGVSEVLDIADWTLKAIDMVSELQRQHIDDLFIRFTENDLALFLPTRNPKAWAAFNVNSPHFFLSAESSKQFTTQIRNRDWILANIVSIDSRVASLADPVSNPFGLADGTNYFWCDVEPWEGMKEIILPPKASSSDSTRRGTSAGTEAAASD
ncbi:oligomeric, coiled-coil, peripheral membrane protein, partial [Dinochytrium kinnereticum]